MIYDILVMSTLGRHNYVIDVKSKLVTMLLMNMCNCIGGRSAQYGLNYERVKKVDSEI